MYIFILTKSMHYIDTYSSNTTKNIYNIKKNMLNLIFYVRVQSQETIIQMLSLNAVWHMCFSFVFCCSLNQIMG